MMVMGFLKTLEGNNDKRQVILKDTFPLVQMY